MTEETKTCDHQALDGRSASGRRSRPSGRGRHGLLQEHLQTRKAVRQGTKSQKYRRQGKEFVDLWRRFSSFPTA